MTFRRGFKAEANWFATSLRAELGLRPYEPICPWRLAELLAIRIVPISELRRFAPKAVAFLLTTGRGKFSAVTVFYGRYGKMRLICHNDGNAKTRQTSDISHELSHAILAHPPKQMFEHDPTAEAEARWMGPTLLVPDEAAHRIASCGQSITDAANDFGVSADLMQMRLNVSGALVRARRRNKRRSA